MTTLLKTKADKAANRTFISTVLGVNGEEAKQALVGTFDKEGMALVAANTGEQRHQIKGALQGLILACAKANTNPLSILEAGRSWVETLERSVHISLASSPEEMAVLVEEAMSDLKAFMGELEDEEEGYTKEEWLAEVKDSCTSPEKMMAAMKKGEEAGFIPSAPCVTQH